MSIRGTGLPFKEARRPLKLPVHAFAWLASVHGAKNGKTPLYGRGFISDGAGRVITSGGAGRPSRRLHVCHGVPRYTSPSPSRRG